MFAIGGSKLIQIWQAIANRLVYKFFDATGKPGERPENNRILWIVMLILFVGITVLYLLQ